MLDARSGEPEVEYEAPFHDVITFHPGSRRVFNAGGGRAELLDVTTGQPILRFAETDCRAAAFSPDGYRLAVADGPAVRIYDATPRPDFTWGESGRGPGKIWLGTNNTANRPMVLYILFVFILTAVLLAAVGFFGVRRLLRRAAHLYGRPNAGK